MIPIVQFHDARVESLLKRLAGATEAALAAGTLRTVQQVIADVRTRGDAALVEIARKFDDPQFSAGELRVSSDEIRAAAARVPANQLSAIRRSIAQVREYQTHVLPKDPPPLLRDGVELGMRFTPIDSVGLYVPGGKASYPSSLIMLAVPALVAGVKRIVVCTPPSQYGRSDLILAVAHELELKDVFRAGGPGAIAAMAFGTASIPRVDKIVGPGNSWVQLAKREVSGMVGIDGFLGPSEVLVLADDSGEPAFIAADLIAQAEHAPGSCFLLTTSTKIAQDVKAEIEKQTDARQRKDAIAKALADESLIIVDESMDRLIDLANRFAAEHVNLQTRDDAAVLKKLTHAGAIFVGRYSPVAAGDYVAGPSHCLPTNTTARFGSGVSVYEFLKRSSIVKYQKDGLTRDAEATVTLAEAEHLDAHAASVKVRTE